MNKISKIVIFTAFLFLLPSYSIAQNNSSLLWKIEGNGMEKPSYLYGTIHIIPKADFHMSPALRKAITTSDVLVMELNLDMGSMMSAMKGMMIPEGKSLQDYLTESQYDSVETFLKDTLGASGLQLNMTKRMKPIFMVQTFYKDLLGEEPMSFELRFKKMADSLNMETLGLEKMEEQMAMLDSIPMETQVVMLMDGVRNYGKMKDEYHKMVEIYKSENLNRLQYFMQESGGDYMEFESLLLNNRNEKWVSKLDGTLGNEQYFIAVGAAHLPGKDGVIKLLERKGYKVSPVSTK